MIRRRRQVNDNALTGLIPSELGNLALALLCVFALVVDDRGLRKTTEL